MEHRRWGIGDGAVGSCFAQWCHSETSRRMWSDKHQRKLPKVAEGAEPRCAAGTE